MLLQFHTHWILTFCKFRIPRIAKMSVFETLSLSKLISRKILVAEKVMNSHTVHERWESKVPCKDYTRKYRSSQFFASFSRKNLKSLILYILFADLSCIGTWSSAPKGEVSSSFETSSDTASTISNNSTSKIPLSGVNKNKKQKKNPLVNISSKYPVFVALRGLQKGRGECLQYRRIENSTLLHVTYYKNACFDPYWPRMNFESNLTWRGNTCQEALMDAHAISKASFYVNTKITTTLLAVLSFIVLLYG